MADWIEQGFYDKGRQEELVEQIKVIDPNASIILGSIDRLQKQLDELEWEQNQKVIENELTKEQKLMLEMSEADIQNGRIIDYKNN